MRGHGASEGRARLTWTSIAEYVADLEQVIEQIGRTPMLVGHSMGGFVLQHYLTHHDAPAAVLMASASHRGLSWRWVSGFVRKNRARVAQAVCARSALPLLNSPDMLPYWFVANLPTERLRHYATLVQDESLRATWDMLGGNLPRPGHVDTPTLVLAAGNDRLLSPAEVYGLAHAYRADLEVVSGVGHVMMLDAGWQRAADRILEWMERLQPGVWSSYR
jgi:pimeloyl-ACP methyl ester carboxylesterase